MFRVAAGTRKLSEFKARGSLFSRHHMFVPIGATARGPRSESEPTTQMAVPVGDYWPFDLEVTCDRLRILVSGNRHGDGSPHAAAREPRYEIKIRKDRPFVLDFSNKPEVLFVSPKKDQRYKRGDQVKVWAALIDPRLNIMIGRLEMIRAGQKPGILDVLQGAKVRDDGSMSLALDPTVRITNSSGKIVAQGVFPPPEAAARAGTRGECRSI